MIVNEKVDTFNTLHNTEHQLTSKSIEGTTQSLTFVVAKSCLERLVKENGKKEFDTQLH